LRINFVEVEEVVGMDEVVSTAVRHKKNSLQIGAKLVAEGLADGFVSSGNTVAATATAKMVIGMLHGVDRPTIVHHIGYITLDKNQNG
jgi:glycerol-3-phosphate acyltransferase PlsX